MAKYVAPAFDEPKFNCPHCGAFAGQRWFSLAMMQSEGEDVEDFATESDVVRRLHICNCDACENYSLWRDEKMIYPQTGVATLAHDDMPDDVKDDFEEARRVVALSPRSAAALLRLGLQRLMPHLGEKGKSIDDDIASLVKKGLDVRIQQACDVVRVTGNECVHPGTMNVNDNPEIAHSLFELINAIVESQIAQPKRIAALYSALPKGKLDGIKRRDSKP